MAYPGVFYSDDAQVLRAMQKATDHGLLTMMHAQKAAPFAPGARASS